MPRGVYKRKPRNPDAPKAKARKGGNGYVDLLAKLQRLKAEDRVVALGTAIEALEALE